MNAKVCQIVTRLGGGGPPISVVNIHRWMRASGLEMVLAFGVCEVGEVDMSYLLQTTDHAVQVPTLTRSPSLVNDVRSLFWVYAWLVRSKPTVVHTHTAKAGFIGRLAALAAGVPIVVHSYHGNVFNNYFGRFWTTAIVWAERLLAKASTVIIVLSSEQKHEITTLYAVAPAGKVRIVPLALNLVGFDAQKPTGNGIRGGGSSFVIGWFGRLVPIKNVSLLVSVLELALRRWPDCICVVAGDGPEMPALLALERQFGSERVKVLGWIEDPDAVIASCDVVLLTSLNEGTPVSLLQSMAIGRFVISTAVGGVPDLLGRECESHNGFCVCERGMLSDATPDAFVAALDYVRFCDGEAYPLEVASSWAHDTYGPRRVVEELKKIYSMP